MEAYRDQQPGTIVVVRNPPAVLELHYPEAFSKPIGVPWSKREYLDRHLWIRDNPEQMFRTLLDPDELRKDSRKPRQKVLFYRRFGDGTLAAVVVEMKTVGTLSNSVITAFDVRTHLEDRRNAEMFIWRKEK